MFVTVTCFCIGCRDLLHCNPNHVPGLVVDGKRRALCEDCFNRWNQLHRIDKGLPPKPLHPEAYQGAPEHEIDWS